MDLRAYYQKIRELEESLTEVYPVMVSLETADGGNPGVRTEVSRGVAAKMIVEGKARLASADEKQVFLDQKAEVKRIADQMEASERMQITVVSQSDLQTLKRSGKPSKTK